MECVVCEMWRATTAVLIQTNDTLSVCGKCEEALDEMGEIIEAWSLD